MPSDTTRSYVRDNYDLIADVLRYSQDAYARACALALLANGGTQRDLERIKADLDLIEDQLA